ncbi:MAG: hypothetical protein IAE89_04150 [Anaerolineae bacterium]|nr:hypothetical protein [Anaerolineae bacterium]
MNSFERIFATSIIWLAVTGIAVAMIFSQQMVNSFLFVVLIAGAFLSTAVVWGTSVALASNKASAERQARHSERNISDKPKRRPHNPGNWLNDLDEDQLQALETALTLRRRHLDEDEQIELNRLLAEQENSRKGY